MTKLVSSIFLFSFLFYAVLSAMLDCVNSFGKSCNMDMGCLMSVIKTFCCYGKSNDSISLQCYSNCYCICSSCFKSVFLSEAEKDVYIDEESSELLVSSSVELSSTCHASESLSLLCSFFTD
uniref:Uncharacterized protein n=1 Tax=Arcuatula senhousia TaxID=1954227 RepID=S5RNV8_ARCSE|nr:hypothetical protein [Arcuatula senhousia]